MEKCPEAMQGDRYLITNSANPQLEQHPTTPNLSKGKTGASLKWRLPEASCRHVRYDNNVVEHLSGAVFSPIASWAGRKHHDNPHILPFGRCFFDVLIDDNSIELPKVRIVTCNARISIDLPGCFRASVSRESRCGCITVK